MIWILVCLSKADLVYFWPMWVAGPWGVLLVIATIGGLSRGEPQRWAEKQASRQARRQERRRRRGGY
ncbi:hypothetical protein Pflav_077980 [Phytohabitans flavus]|uniref:TIGR04438 family Trp-rich protein n=2 Tax=Phytohabitans flavus TaxID=1076124 RepID=A0A6F8Y5X7_9ACTN|nr:hypothetical protein [Phytohabitans flavus]BCB81388.1 hypothetical protein Pflav_077980 [Phytohabitans flavus]